jgi:hypothetical protein
MAMTNPNELIQHQLILEQPLGELALRRDQPEQLFGVTDDEIFALTPSVIAGIAGFKDVVIAINPGDKKIQEYAKSGDLETETVTDPAQKALAEGEPAGYSRDEIRKGKQSMYRAPLAKLIQTGAQYVAGFGSKEEGTRAAYEILPQEVDEYLGDLVKTRIVPAAQPIKTLRETASQARSDIESIAQGDGDTQIHKRYTLLKACGFDRYEGKERDPQAKLKDPTPEFTLAALYAMESMDTHKQLASELYAGKFDHLIAHDILWHIDAAQQVDGDLAKVQQLVKMLRAFHSGQPEDKPNFYNRMVSLLDNWPQAQRQVVIDARQMLVDRMEAKLGRTSRALRDGDFIIDNPGAAFNDSVTYLSDAMLSRAIVTPQNRAEIMRLRAIYSMRKRGRQTPRRERRRDRAKNDETAAAQETGPREPAKIVVCNLNDYSISESPDVLLDELAARFSQGNTIRDDFAKMLNFMVRRDLPPTHRRGVKSMTGILVRFGTDEEPDKLWNLFELKPSDAAGLSLRTDIAKHSRVYFIKYSENTLGIIGIKPRSEQEEFIKSIRIKAKRRGEN